MNPTKPAWLLLVVSLPTASATARMRIWRNLKSLGCVALRDGAYLLPEAIEYERALQGLAKECNGEGGSAWLMSVLARSDDETVSLRQLFDRSEDFAELRRSWRDINRSLGALGAPELVRLRRKLQREFEAAVAIDFFPGDSRVETHAAWTDIDKRIESLLSPGEPQETEGQIPVLDPALYQGRLWATRQRLWVDRVASAWLIRRFIDQEARFQWLTEISECPHDALGFDFDGAAFTHVGDRVTFQTLIASFNLNLDRGLARLASMVHALDVGGDPVPEAKGFEAVLAGARERLQDDDALLAEMSNVLDSLYAHFTREA